MNLEDKKVLILGGTGFLGQHVHNAMSLRGADVIGLGSQNGDLKRPEIAADLIRGTFPNPPDLLIHLAAPFGGGNIQLAKLKPATLLHGTLLMNANVLQAAAEVGVQKLITVGSATSYSIKALNDPPTPESRLHKGGLPEHTYAPYGLAKKIMHTHLQALRDEMGLNGVYLIPDNFYGPGDKFTGSGTHLITSTIMKILAAEESGSNEITCWGSGRITRSFLFVEDLAEAICLAAEVYDERGAINLGGSEELPIRAVVHEICRLMQFKGDVHWDLSKPDGASRRRLDINMAKDLLDWSPSTSLESGLMKTIQYARQMYGAGTEDSKWAAI